MHTKTYRADDGTFKKAEDLSRAEIEGILQRTEDYQRGWADGHNEMVELMTGFAKALAGHKA